MSSIDDKVRQLLSTNSVNPATELLNFARDVVRILPQPGELPKLNSVDIYGKLIPLKGVIGGDHIIYIDFKRMFDLDEMIARAKQKDQADITRNLQKNKSRAGIMVLDVSGHNITDALTSAMVHQAFMVGVRYELQMYGHVTKNLFEHLNNRINNTSAISKFVTAIYGEIGKEGSFKFLSAGHPAPIVFSYEFSRITAMNGDRYETCPPLGLQASPPHPTSEKADTSIVKSPYQVHEINLLSPGDILILYTDGLQEHGLDRSFTTLRLESVLQRTKHLSAKGISDEIEKELKSWAGQIDDISYVVIKKEF